MSRYDCCNQPHQGCESGGYCSLMAGHGAWVPPTAQHYCGYCGRDF